MCACNHRGLAFLCDFVGSWNTKPRTYKSQLIDFSVGICRNFEHQAKARTSQKIDFFVWQSCEEVWPPSQWLKITRDGLSGGFKGLWVPAITEVLTYLCDFVGSWTTKPRTYKSQLIYFSVRICRNFEHQAKARQSQKIDFFVWQIG